MHIDSKISLKQIRFVLNKVNILLFLFMIAPGLYAQPFLTFSVGNIAGDYIHTDDYQGIADKLLKEALARIGYGLKVVVLPTERSLMMANSGRVDGDLYRTPGIEQAFPNLIRIPELLSNVEFVVFSRQPIDLSNGWNSLKGKSVGLVIGYKIVERRVPKKALITRVKTPKLLFNMLEQNKVEYIVLTRAIGESILKELGFKGISASDQTLLSLPVYTYLNEKNIGLASQIANALRDMKQDGTYKEIHDAHRRSYNER